MANRNQNIMAQALLRATQNAIDRGESSGVVGSHIVKRTTLRGQINWTGRGSQPVRNQSTKPKASENSPPADSAVMMQQGEVIAWVDGKFIQKGAN